MTKDRWEKLGHIGTFVGLVATPIVIAIVGGRMTDSSASRTTSKDYVQLAIEILRSPTKDTDPAVRDWALEVLKKFSPIPITTAQEAAFLHLPPYLMQKVYVSPELTEEEQNLIREHAAWWSNPHRLELPKTIGP